MRLVRTYREGFEEGRFHELFEPPYKYFTHCQIIVYSDQDPSGSSGEGLWVKLVCPWDTGAFGHEWMKVMG